MSRPITQLKCFYHPQQNIINMCLHQQCLLPLCTKCKQIHQKKINNTQLKNNKQLHIIVKYQQAKNIAINNIKQQNQQIQEQIKLFNRQFNVFKTVLKQMLDKQLNNIENNLRNNILKFQHNLENIIDQQNKIKENKLSSIIGHYERRINNNQFQWNFVNQIKQEEFGNLINSFFTINKINKPKISRINTYEKSQEQIMNSTPKNMISIQSFQKQKQNLSVKKKIKPGIFVTASPRQAGTPRSKLQISKRTIKSEISQIQTIKDNEIQIKMSQSTISKRKHMMHKMNQSAENLHIVRQEKPQNLLFPKKVSIYIQSPRNQDNILKQSKNSSLSIKSRKNVINRSELATNSSSSRLLTSKNKDKKFFNQILSPQQMKLLIIRKTGNLKQISHPQRIYSQLNCQM